MRVHVVSYAKWNEELRSYIYSNYTQLDESKPSNVLMNAVTVSRSVLVSYAAIMVEVQRSIKNDECLSVPELIKSIGRDSSMGRRSVHGVVVSTTLSQAKSRGVSSV